MAIDTGRVMGERVTGDIERFRAEVRAYYGEHARDLPWRRTHDDYAILVSEVMLQQTQVPRVIPRFAAFLERFPSLASLASAAPASVLSEWQGLGYNRRALALHQTATIALAEFGGVLPRSLTELERLPGIGHATAAALCVYAFGIPIAFIETNVRAAFIHFFFQECTDVRDADILPLVEQTLDRDDPRNWYYALMDYGTWVKRTNPNPGRRSKHHSTQAPFAGSRRQARAAALRVLLSRVPHGLTPQQLRQAEPVLAQRDEEETEDVLRTLCVEGFLVCEAGVYRVA